MALPTKVDQYAKCRGLLHAWDDFNPIDKRPPTFGYRISLRCVRCTAERHDIIDLNGNVTSRQYEYPAGYRYTKDELPSRADFRLQLVVAMRRANRVRPTGKEVVDLRPKIAARSGA